MRNNHQRLLSSNLFKWLTPIGLPHDDHHLQHRVSIFKTFFKGFHFLFSRPLDASANAMLDHSNGYLSYQLSPSTPLIISWLVRKTYTYIPLPSLCLHPFLFQHPSSLLLSLLSLCTLTVIAIFTTMASCCSTLACGLNLTFQLTSNILVHKCCF